MPAARSRATTAASRVGTWLRSEGEPAVVVTPATSKVSLMVHGTPWSGPARSRRARASSAARARSTASGARATMALSWPLYCWIRSRIRVVSSTEEICPLRIARPASRAEAKSRSLAPARAARNGASALAVTVASPPARNPRRVSSRALTAPRRPAWASSGRWTPAPGTGRAPSRRGRCRARGTRGHRDVPRLHLEAGPGDLAAAGLEVHEVLGDEEVGDRGGDVQRGGQADGGAVVVVGRDRDQRGLGHLGDGAQLQDAAAVAHVGVDDVGRAQLEGAPELGAGVELLAGDDRDRDLPPALRERLQVRGGHRLLVPEGPEALHLARDPHRVHGGQAPVHLDQQIHLGADRLAHRGHVGHRLLLGRARDVGAPGAGERIELQRVEAAADRVARPRRVLHRGLRAAVPAVGVDAHALATRAAQQRVHRHAVALARDVPERLLEPAHRAPEVHRAALGREVVVGPVHEVGDVARVAPHEVAADRLHERHDARVAVGLRVALAPAVRAAVGLDLDEAEVLAAAEIGQERGDAAHAHDDDRSGRDRIRIERTGASVIRFPRSSTASCTP